MKTNIEAETNREVHPEKETENLRLMAEAPIPDSNPAPCCPNRIQYNYFHHLQPYRHLFYRPSG